MIVHTEQEMHGSQPPPNAQDYRARVAHCPTDACVPSPGSSECLAALDLTTRTNGGAMNQSDIPRGSLSVREWAQTQGLGYVTAWHLVMSGLVKSYKVGA